MVIELLKLTSTSTVLLVELEYEIVVNLRYRDAPEGITSPAEIPS
jgi:hypothetical protein